jgi:sporulation protein YabP
MDKNFIQNIILENREKLSVSGVSDILTFDEEEIMLETELGTLQIKGSGLKVEKLSVDTGEVLAKGEIDSLSYTNETVRRGGFFKNMFR